MPAAAPRPAPGGGVSCVTSCRDPESWLEAGAQSEADQTRIAVVGGVVLRQVVETDVVLALVVRGLGGACTRAGVEESGRVRGSGRAEHLERVPGVEDVEHPDERAQVQSRHVESPL